MADQRKDPAVSVFFRVAIDGHDLGTFSKCEGLAFTVKVEEVREGGNNGYVHKLPGRIEYQNVKLTRAVNADSKKLADWFGSLAEGPVKRTGGRIAAVSADGKEEIAVWSLTGVIPVSWTGPSFGADSLAVATETFELAHHGFLGAGS
jgi:phage tail-like protein